jgi:hypothetical protein
MGKRKNFEKRIIVSVTGHTAKDFEKKFTDVKKHKLRKVALFLEYATPAAKKVIYESLPKSGIKEIPLVHIRNDTKKWELEYLKKKYGSKYFTIHECSFRRLEEWNGFHKELYLEMNYDNRIWEIVNVQKIGGFCVDLSHFKAGEEKWSKDFEYVVKREGVKRYFKCNHLNGYNPKKNCDMHWIKNLKNFDYLETLPEFVFGNAIAIETYNSIEDQLKYKKYLVKLLNKKFNQ